jgi:hypothetical protein
VGQYSKGVCENANQWRVESMGRRGAGAGWNISRGGGNLGRRVTEVLARGAQTKLRGSHLQVG